MRNFIYSREQPLENLKSTLDSMTGDEQWFDCETHSPVNLKDGHRTPEYRPTPSRCPPAPNRPGVSFLPSSDDELQPDDDEDLNESGICPLDTSIELGTDKPPQPECKRLKLEVEEVTTINEQDPPAESNFSDLFYFETTGSVTINRVSRPSDEAEKRDCQLLVSYRFMTSDPTTIQIALIVYKRNSQNPKTCRNLMLEFAEEADQPNTSTSTPSTSRSRTTVKDRKKPPHDKSTEISTEPAGAKYSKATKRPMISKTSLRF